MVRLIIDRQPVQVPPGSTILQAARKLGLDIPALCFLDGHPPFTSCLLCLVKVKGRQRPVPSCATPVQEGMQVESESRELRRLRRTGLELLLSAHLGDCIAPCRKACPAGLDIPLMLRQVAAGRLRQAMATIKKDLALPAVLGRLCPRLCEKGCRLRELGRPASICLVERYVAERDLAWDAPYLSPCKPATGKRVAIVGSGPTGLAAAYHLLHAGHACSVFEARAEPGGTLRTTFDTQQLPRRILDAEIAWIERLGAGFRLGQRIGGDVALGDLRNRFDAVLLAVGAPSERETEPLGLPAKKGRLVVNRRTHQTDLPGVFAAGQATRPGRLVIRSVADGKKAALCIDQYLCRSAVTGPPKSFACRAGPPAREEVERLAAGLRLPRSTAGPPLSADDMNAEQARREALRCLHCDCGRRDSCRLRHYAQMYGAKANRYPAERRTFERHLHQQGLVYEPGKCILCGRCVRIAEQAGEPLGLALIGRGFDVRVGVPFDRSMAEGLTLAAHHCAEACPTGALVLRAECGRGRTRCHGPGASHRAPQGPSAT